jgi:hypothetical protein
MRKAIASFLAVLACFGVVGVAQASAYTEYANHVGVESGANYFGPYVSVYAAATELYRVGIGCAGLRGLRTRMSSQIG